MCIQLITAYCLLTQVVTEFPLLKKECCNLSSIYFNKCEIKVKLTIKIAVIWSVSNRDVESIICFRSRIAFFLALQKRLIGLKYLCQLWFRIHFWQHWKRICYTIIHSKIGTKKGLHSVTGKVGHFHGKGHCFPSL